MSGRAVAFDIGIQYHGVAGVNGLKLGVALKNVGSQVTYDGTGLLRLALAEGGARPTQFYKSQAASWELPSSVEIGLSYGRTMGESMSYNLNSSFTNNNLALDSYKVGGEVVYEVGESLAVAGRGGIDLLDKGADDTQIFGPTMGFGIIYRAGVDITVDYAYRTVDFFESNNMFSLKLGF